MKFTITSILVVLAILQSSIAVTTVPKGAALRNSVFANKLEGLLRRRPLHPDPTISPKSAHEYTVTGGNPKIIAEGTFISGNSESGKMHHLRVDKNGLIFHTGYSVQDKRINFNRELQLTPEEAQKLLGTNANLLPSNVRGPKTFLERHWGKVLVGGGVATYALVKGLQKHDNGADEAAFSNTEFTANSDAAPIFQLPAGTSFQQPAAPSSDAANSF